MQQTPYDRSLSPGRCSQYQGSQGGSYGNRPTPYILPGSSCTSSQPVQASDCIRSSQRLLPCYYSNRVPPEACLDAAANIPETELPNIITLHAASAKMSTSERISVSCNCRPPRCTGKCRCLKNKVKCSVHCHATEFDCHNLSELAIRTEVALVDRGMEEDEQFPEKEQLQEEKQVQEEKQPLEEGPQEEESREEEQPHEQDYGLSGIQDSNDLPPPSRKRTRQATPATAPEHTAGGRVLRKRR